MLLRSIGIGAAALSFVAAALAEEAGSQPGQDNSTAAALAHPKRKHAVNRAPQPDCCEPYRYVYGESWYGNRKAVAPVRRGAQGDEVQLPGGVWVACEFSCEYILRKQSLDYWEKQGSGTGSQYAPTYPREDWYVDGWGNRHGYMF